MPDDTWQEQWQAGGFDDEGAESVCALAREGDRVDSADPIAGIEPAFCLRVVRPSISGYRANRFRDYPRRFRDLPPDPLLERLFAAADAFDVHHMHRVRAKCDLTAVLTHAGHRAGGPDSVGAAARSRLFSPPSAAPVPLKPRGGPVGDEACPCPLTPRRDGWPMLTAHGTRDARRFRTTLR
ncbi:hypothetical protein QFZ63_001357 [Streptomyces sp. B3I7]|nr:hypothetical protein [Streptomyces sp. B3I7]